MSREEESIKWDIGMKRKDLWDEGGEGKLDKFEKTLHSRIVFLFKGERFELFELVGMYSSFGVTSPNIPIDHLHLCH